MAEITIALLVTVVVLAIIGVMKFFERKYGTNPEAWDKNKFLMFIGVGIVVMLVEYYYSGVINEFVPSEELLTLVTSAFTFGYVLITGGKLTKNYIASGGVATPVTTATPIVNPAWSIGFTATPVFSVIKSGQSVTFHLFVGHDANLVDVPNVAIDWMDGSPIQVVKMIDNFAQVTHTFNYSQGSSQYTGHSFYPEFTLMAADGSTAVFNVEGKMLEVEVQSNS